MQETLIKIIEVLLMAGVSAIVVMEYFHTFFKKKDMKATGCLVWMLFIIWKIITDYGMTEFSILSRVVLSILFFISASVFFYGNLLAKIFFSILQVAMGMLVESLVGYFFIIVGISIESNMLIGAMVSKILLLMIVKALQLFFCNRTIRELSWKTNLVFMLLPMGSIFLIHHIFIAEYKLKEPGFKSTVMMCMIIILAINIVVFHLYLRLSENLELKYKNAIYEKELNLLDVHMKEKETVMVEFRRKRHDLKHQMLEMLSLLENKQYEKLEESMKELANFKSLDSVKFVNTENSMVDAFINYKYEIAKKDDIEFRVKLDIPAQLPFANSDLCIILGNVLDNALEANLRGRIEHPYIDLKMLYDGDNLIMIVENSFDGNIFKNWIGERITRKADKENHGLGIGSIQNVVKKYHGDYEVMIKENRYCLKILLHGNE